MRGVEAACDMIRPPKMGRSTQFYRTADRGARVGRAQQSHGRVIRLQALRALIRWLVSSAFDTTLAFTLGLVKASVGDVDQYLSLRFASGWYGQVSLQRRHTD